MAQPDLYFQYDPKAQIVYLTIAPNAQKTAQRIKTHPWFVDVYGRRCAKIDVALQMIRFYKTLQLPMGVDTNLLAHFELVKRAQAERLELIDKSFTLWPYQVEGVKRLIAARRGFLTDEMGLGKTLQAIGALRPNDGVTVICPSVVKGHWAAEIGRARPTFQSSIMEGRQPDFLWAKPRQVQIYNKEILPATPAEEMTPSELALHKALNDGQEPPAVHAAPIHRQSVIIDEAHFVRNRKTAAHKRIKAITTAAYGSGGNLIALTATPMLNKPGELWNVLSAIELAEDLFGTWFKFVNAFNGKFTAFGLKWGTAKPYVEEILSFGMLRRKKAEVLKDLPPKRHRIYPVHTDFEPLKLGKPLREMSAEEAQLIGAIAIRRRDLAIAKIPALMELVEEYEDVGEPLVVFSAHSAPIKHLGDRKGWAAITGETPDLARSMYVDRFQKGIYKGLALTIATGGVGITLTRSANVIFVDRSWTPGEDEQAEDRLHRIGQDRPVMVTDLVSNDAIDQRVFEVSTGKVDLLKSVGLGFSAAKVEAARPAFEVDVGDQETENYPECSCPGDIRNCPLHSLEAVLNDRCWRGGS